MVDEKNFLGINRVEGGSFVGIVKGFGSYVVIMVGLIDDF